MFVEHREPIELILASRSPRRRELLAEHGYTFRVVPPSASAECGVCSGETPAQLVARLAWQKASDVAAQCASGWIIGCDTVAECLGQILGKPHDLAHARQMLMLIRGREHQVLSGLCLWDVTNQRHQLGVAVTRLFMEPISDDQLEAYLDSGDWDGKAGAFGYQDGHSWLRILEGSASNVVGLPMELLADMIASVRRSSSATPAETTARAESPRNVG
jgi:septum formation protein